MMKALFGSLCAGAMLLSCGPGQADGARSRDGADLVSSPVESAPIPDAVETTVNSGGFSFFFRIFEGGSVVVLLESAGGMDSTQWYGLSPDLWKATGATIIAYDRPGFGRSEAPEGDYDIGQEARALREALLSAGYFRNLVIVGHSWGGLVARVELGEWGGEVRGLVLLDPTSIEFVDAIGIREYYGDWVKDIPVRPGYQGGNKEYRGLARLVGKDEAVMDKNVGIARAVDLPKGLPSRVVARGRKNLSDEAKEAAWRAALAELSLSLGTELIVDDKSDHFITSSDPELVIALVAEVVAAVR
jgi:pimeloyl-ACP methyl ester carboxylesterase